MIIGPPPPGTGKGRSGPLGGTPKFPKDPEGSAILGMKVKLPSSDALGPGPHPACLPLPWRPQWGTPRRWGANPQNTPGHPELWQPHSHLGQRTGEGCRGPRPDARRAVTPGRGHARCGRCVTGHETGGGEMMNPHCDHLVAEVEGPTIPPTGPVPPAGPARGPPDRLRGRGFLDVRFSHDPNPQAGIWLVTDSSKRPLVAG